LYLCILQATIYVPQENAEANHKNVNILSKVTLDCISTAHFKSKWRCTIELNKIGDTQHTRTQLWHKWEQDSGRQHLQPTNQPATGTTAASFAPSCPFPCLRTSRFEKLSFSLSLNNKTLKLTYLVKQ
jgi:hypothetical protein